MKKLLYIFILIFIFISCGTKKSIVENWIDVNMISKTALYTYEYDCNRYELDSVCNIYEIPSELSLWISSAYINNETYIPVTKYVYTKPNYIDSLMDNTYIITTEIQDIDTLFHLEVREVRIIN